MSSDVSSSLLPVISHARSTLLTICSLAPAQETPSGLQDRLDVVEGFGKADLQFGDLVEVALFGDEVEVGHKKRLCNWIDKACCRIPVAEIYGRIASYIPYRAFRGVTSGVIERLFATLS